MAEPLAPSWLVTIGEYLQEESEKLWFWFSVFIVTLLVFSSLSSTGSHALMPPRPY